MGGLRDKSAASIYLSVDDKNTIYIKKYYIPVDCEARFIQHDINLYEWL
jgi:hypothetical protein